MQRITQPIESCRLLIGMWQTSGGWGEIKPKIAVIEMVRYFDMGYTTFDMADHYGPAEDLYGMFLEHLRKTRGEEVAKQAQGFTKWVPSPGKMTKEIVEKNIQISLNRMKVSCLDSLQFHWWEYKDNNYLVALKHLDEMRKQGKIKAIALTNFDTEHLKIINDNGIQIATNQVQFSLVDMRPTKKMCQYCEERNIKLLTYGTLLGGLMNEKYLGIPEDKLDLNTPSMRKYKGMINAWGGWELYQQLLQVLKKVATKHDCKISNIAIKYILDQPAVGGVIVGARLGLSNHMEVNLASFQVNLDDEDRNEINQVLAMGNDLMKSIGDCGAEYRR